MVLLAGLALIVVLSNPLRQNDLPPDQVTDADLIPIVEVSSFDPFGDQRERDSELPNLIDGDSGTAWRTETYRTSPRFGNLKPGVGVWVDLGTSQEVGSVVLETSRIGWTGLLYATDASEYQELPLAVALPRNEDDVRKLVEFAATHGTSLIPRTAGNRVNPIPCQIQQILPLDTKALKAAERDIRQQRESADAERAAQSSGT